MLGGGAGVVRGEDGDQEVGGGRDGELDGVGEQVPAGRDEAVGAWWKVAVRRVPGAASGPWPCRRATVTAPRWSGAVPSRLLMWTRSACPPTLRWTTLRMAAPGRAGAAPEGAASQVPVQD